MKTLIHEREPFGGCSRTNGEREDHTALSVNPSLLFACSAVALVVDMKVYSTGPVQVQDVARHPRVRILG